MHILFDPEITLQEISTLYTAIHVRNRCTQATPVAQVPWETQQGTEWGLWGWSMQSQCNVEVTGPGPSCPLGLGVLWSSPLPALSSPR